MKRKFCIFVCVLISVLVLIIPRKDIYNDGGTVTYTSLNYKIIKWHKLSPDNPNVFKEGTEIYFFPNNFHDLGYYE